LHPVLARTGGAHRYLCFGGKILSHLSAASGEIVITLLFREHSSAVHTKAVSR